ncbi:unnamed protein product [Litomosoides sigmodontis]|uniref:Uncharacterized protein n=1 Tax=Litomosoides sigmodontis TaxID=42156 RepID=A0A3P6UD87_LITSI|nr:unnamed protein product [Litomosoides sigmodontis]
MCTTGEYQIDGERYHRHLLVQHFSRRCAGGWGELGDAVEGVVDLMHPSVARSISLIIQNGYNDKLKCSVVLECLEIIVSKCKRQNLTLPPSNG